MDKTPLHEKVRAELLAIRKTPDGFTVNNVSASPVLCALLGDGDPRLAYSRFRERALTSDLDTSINAALASLRLTSDHDTVLARLDEFGSERGYDQRQVRRYSDKGIAALANLTAYHWPTDTVPQLTVLLLGVDRSIEMHLMTKHQQHIEMGKPRVRISRDDKPKGARLKTHSHAQNGWIERSYMGDLLFGGDAPLTIDVVWPGELWPLFHVVTSKDAYERRWQFWALGRHAVITSAEIDLR